MHALEVFFWLCVQILSVLYICTLPISASRTDCTAQHVSSVHGTFDLPANIGSTCQLCVCGEIVDHI